MNNLNNRLKNTTLINKQQNMHKMKFQVENEWIKNEKKKKWLQQWRKRTEVKRKRKGTAFTLTNDEFSFKTQSFRTLIDEDDDGFGEMKIVKVLAGRRRVRDLFDVSE